MQAAAELVPTAEVALLLQVVEDLGLSRLAADLTAHHSSAAKLLGWHPNAIGRSAAQRLEYGADEMLCSARLEQVLQPNSRLAAENFAHTWKLLVADEQMCQVSAPSAVQSVARLATVPTVFLLEFAQTAAAVEAGLVEQVHSSSARNGTY